MRDFEHEIREAQAKADWKRVGKIKRARLRAAAVAQGKAWSWQQMVSAAAVLLVVVGTAASIFLRLHPPPRPADTSQQQALGQVLAEETSLLVGSKGKVAVLTLEPSRDFFAQAVLQSFSDRLKKEGVVSIVAIHAIQPEQLAPYDAGMGVIPAMLLREALQKSPDANAVVCLVGAPEYRDDLVRDLRQRQPKLIVCSRHNAKLKNLFQAGVLHLAVVNRFQALPTSVEIPRTSRARFDRSYQLVTADTASALPY